MIALVWLKTFSLWPRRCELKGPENYWMCTPFLAELPQSGEVGPPRTNAKEIQRDNSSLLSKPQQRTPSAQTIIPSKLHFRHNSRGVIVSIRQYSPECEVDLLLDFARIAN